MLARLEAHTLTAEDRRGLGKVLTFYFWLLLALREAKLSLKRVKALVFGEKPKKPKPPAPSGTAGDGSGGGSETQTRGAQGRPSAAVAAEAEKKPHRPGHGRQSATVYRAAQAVECRHEELAVGERCPACGRGRLYRLPSGIEMRLDGPALLSAVR